MVARDRTREGEELKRIRELTRHSAAKLNSTTCAQNNIFKINLKIIDLLRVCDTKYFNFE